MNTGSTASAWRLRGIAACLALCLAAPSLAQEDDAWDAGDEAASGFVIRTAFTDLVDGVYHLYADIDYGIAENALEALENGVPLTFEVEIKVIRQRRWMWDQTVKTIHQQYRLEYHALAERFVLRDLNTGTQASYMGLRAAATELGRISDMPVMDADDLLDGARYEVRLRVRLVVEAFPAPMRWVALSFPRWRHASDWYAWMMRS